MVPGPTYAGFLAFVRNQMQISTAIMPDSSASLQEAYDASYAWVNPAIAQAPGPFYSLAVYNLGGSYLLNYANDLPGAAVVPGSKPPLPFFAFTREKWNLQGFVSGVVQSAGDEGTNTSLIVQKAAETFTLADIQNLKDPYGRRYLEIAQQYGTLWGLN